MDDSKSVEQFRALGEPVRWAIVRELQTGTRCACVLAEMVDVSAPLLSHHLKVLREAGLITGTKRGRWIDYTLDPTAVRSLATALTVGHHSVAPDLPRRQVTSETGSLVAGGQIR